MISDEQGKKWLLPSKPIIGQRRGKTIWLVFFKE